MKTPALLIVSALLPLGLCHGQTAAVFDAQVNSTLTTKLNATNTALGLANTALDKLAKWAGDYGTGGSSQFPTDIRAMRDALTGADNGLVKKIEEISNVLGDPNNERPAKFNDLVRQVRAWIDDGKLSDSPRYDKNIDDPTGKNDGEQAFNATADGLFDSIGAKYKPDPTKDDMVDRDKKLYTGSVNQLAAVNHYYKIREAAIERREALQDLLKDTLDAVQDAKDFATLAKQTALVESIEAQLKVCSDDINTAYNDVAVRSIQMFTMSQIKTTADNEPLGKQLADKMAATTDLDPSKLTGGGTTTGGTTTGTGTATSGFFPWIKYNY